MLNEVQELSDQAERTILDKLSFKDCMRRAKTHMGHAKWSRKQAKKAKRNGLVLTEAGYRERMVTAMGLVAFWSNQAMNAYGQGRF